ncbi:MAG: TRAP transporter large permease [Pseudomonadota bacterium]
MLSPEAIGLVALLGMVVLILLRMPVGLAMVVTGIVGNYALSLAVPWLRFEPYLAQFKTLLWGIVSNYELSIIPLFVLMGYLSSEAGLSRDIFRGLNALLGRVRGGVAIAAIGACAAFGAVSGSSVATASTMGRIALPELKRLSYAPSFAAGTLAAGGTLGILIPPSVALVLYAVIVEASIVDMFRAAVIPGILAVGFFALVILITARARPEVVGASVLLGAREKRGDLIRLVPVLAIFGSIIAGLGLGVFTPTPAAAVGASLILIYGLVLGRRDASTRGLNAAKIKSAILQTAVTAGMIYFILFGAEVLKGFLARAGLPAAMATLATQSGLDPWLILIGLLILLIVIGCIMDSLAMILVVVPFFWPALVGLNGGPDVMAAEATFGMNHEDLKIWFGILALVVVELGLITPPVGLNVLVIASLDRAIPMGRIFNGVLPFFGIETVRVALLLMLPGLSLWLPHYLSG